MPRTENRRGKLVVIGCGLQAPRHVSERGLEEIRRADVVFVLADPFALDWVRSINPNIRNLCEHYDDERDRRDTYRDMEQALLNAVLDDVLVCAVFYGHPGVFAQVSHRAIAQVRAAGREAHMEPGISSEACLYADLGLDPGHRGVQSIETTQFLAFRHVLNPGSLVLLWQVALAGSLDCVGFDAHPERLRVLVDKLMQWYGSDTDAILYEAARLPIEDFRADPLKLTDLPQAKLRPHTTLVIPPARPLEADGHWRDILERTG